MPTHEKMRDGDAQGIRGVQSPVHVTHPEHGAHHERNLFLLGTTGSHDSLLDQRRRIIADAEMP